MKLLPWVVCSFWMAVGVIQSGRFYGPSNMKMKITSPILQSVVRSRFDCAAACLSKLNCYSFSVTDSSGPIECRFGGVYNASRSADPGSNFYVREVTTAGYKPVPGTSSYVKIVLDPTKTWFQAKAECEKDVGGRLAVPNNKEMHDYLNKTMIENGPNMISGFWFLVGGQSTTQFAWHFLDGTSLIQTRKGEGYFHPNEPDTPGGGACLAVSWKYPLAPICCGYWADKNCTTTSYLGGYFCEIKLPK